MRIHYSGADPSGNSDCTELFSGIVVFDRYGVCPQFWTLCHISVIVSGQLGAPKSDLPVGTPGIYQGSLT